jgi:hypothetical protein
LSKTETANVSNFRIASEYRNQCFTGTHSKFSISTAYSILSFCLFTISDKSNGYGYSDSRRAPAGRVGFDEFEDEVERLYYCTSKKAVWFLVDHETYDPTLEQKLKDARSDLEQESWWWDCAFLLLSIFVFLLPIIAALLAEAWLLTASVALVDVGFLLHFKKLHDQQVLQICLASDIELRLRECRHSDS